MKNFLTILVVIILLQMVKGCISNPTQISVNSTNANQSRYNTMNPADYHEEMKSENLQYSDIAWHASKTYGWNCEEITSLGSPVNTSGQELRYANLISEIKGYYNVATCTSGVKVRVYPRYDTYPIITNINGGFE